MNAEDGRDSKKGKVAILEDRWLQNPALSDNKSVVFHAVSVLWRGREALFIRGLCCRRQSPVQHEGDCGRIYPKHSTHLRGLG